MDNQGFVKLHRKILEWGWYKDANTIRLFLHCLLKANWKDGNFQGYEIPRGSFVTSVNSLSNELSSNKHKFTTQAVRTSLKHLNSTNEITIKTTNKFTIITINNYDNYQEDNKAFNKQLTNKQQTTNKQLTTIEEYKNRKKERSERENIERELSSSPTLTDIISYGTTLGASSEYCERFYNHYESIGWVNANGIKIKNWKLTFNNWFKKDVESGKTKNKKEYDTRAIYTERETGRDFQYDKEGNKCYVSD